MTEESISILDQLMKFGNKNCPFCKAEIKTRILDKKFAIIHEESHFCTEINGVCKLSKSYRKASNWDSTDFVKNYWKNYRAKNTEKFKQYRQTRKLRKAMKKDEN